MRYSKLTLSFLFCLCLFTYFACKRGDALPEQGKQSDVEKRFFTVSATTDPIIKSISENIAHQNNRSSFVNNLAKKIGYPRWDKAIATPASQSTRNARQGNASNFQYAYIPFVRDSDNYTNSALIVKMNGKDTLYKLLYAQQYRKFGFDSSVKHWTAKDVFNLFTSFDNTIFGHTSFLIKDSRLAGKDSAQKIRAEISKAPVNGRMALMEIEICKTYHLCIIVEQTARKANARETIVPNGSCWDYTSCTTLYYDEGGSGGGSDPYGDGWSSGSTGGTTGGTSSSGGTTSGSTNDPTQDGNNWYNYDPCSGITTARLSMASPCDGGTIGWEPISTDIDPLTGFSHQRFLTLISRLQQDPDYLIPCNFLGHFQFMSTFKPPVEVTNRLNNLYQSYNNNNYVFMPNFTPPFTDQFYLQTLEAAQGSTVNMDYFPIHINELPTVNGVKWTPKDLLDFFRKDINSFIDTQIATFSPYNDGVTNDEQLWNSDDPLTAMLHLNMAKNGSVIVSRYNYGGDWASFIVTTLQSPLDGNHPLGGNRKWGIEPDPSGGYMFYTTAVDRIYTSEIELGDWIMEHLTGTSGFDQADVLWRSLQDKMISFITAKGGSANKYITPEIKSRPQWNDVRDFLQGKISEQEMRTKMGCP